MAAYSNIQEPDDFSHAKYFMPFMHRLGYLPMYQNLTDEERKEVLADMRDKVKKSRILPLSQDTVSYEDYPGLTNIEDYLTNLIEGKDPLKDIYLAGYGSSSPETLGMKSETDIGGSEKEVERNGAVIELRKLGSEVKPEALKAFALALFDLIKEINRQKVVEEKQKEEVRNEGKKTKKKCVIC